MNGKRLLVDTNIIVYILSGDQEYLKMVSDAEIFVSFVSELEILCYRFDTDEEERTARSFFEDIHILDIDDRIKDAVIVVKRKYKLKLPDSIILATALVHSVELVTNDTDLMNTYRLALSDSDIQVWSDWST